MSINLDRQNYKQQILNDFNHRTNYDSGRFYKSVGKRLVELAALQNGQHVLDLATGTGIVALEAAKIVGEEGEVIGVDISSGMLKSAQEKLFKSGLKNVKFIEADIEKIGEDKDLFADNSFDVIFCSLAVCYVQNVDSFFQQCYRLLKPRGIIAFNAWEEKAFPPSIIFREVASNYGLEIVNPNEFLGSPHKCYTQMHELGFQNIKIICEDFGWSFTPNREYAEEAWERNSKNVFGYQVNFLPDSQKAECKAEYIKAIESLPVSDNQTWCNALLNFAIASK